MLSGSVRSTYPSGEAQREEKLERWYCKLVDAAKPMPFGGRRKVASFFEEHVTDAFVEEKNLRSVLTAIGA
jgi:hypothetical protein